jgi:hypothetical protein
MLVRAASIIRKAAGCAALRARAVYELICLALFTHGMHGHRSTHLPLGQSRPL